MYEKRRPVLSTITGGMSGAAVKPIALRKVGTLFELTKHSAYFFYKYVHFHLKTLFLYVPKIHIFVWKSKKRIPDNDYLVYKREKEYASKDGGNCTSYLKI